MSFLAGTATGSFAAPLHAFPFLDAGSSMLEHIRHTAAFAEHYITPVIIVLLLVLDVVALRYGLREARERRRQIEEIRRTARVYSRESYELLVLQSIQRASLRIYCYWHSLNTTAATPRYQAFNKQLAEAQRSGRDVRLITAKDPSRVAPARELIGAGVDVRFQQALVLSDLRFTLIDNDLIIFGLIPHASDREQPSREGADVTSRRLVSLLAHDYIDQWDSADSYDKYLTEIVSSARHDPESTAAMVAEQLGIPNDDIDPKWVQI